MKVVHIVECFAAGTAHFINLLTRYTSCEHVVIHGERLDEISAEAVKAKFPKGVQFIHWQNVQREVRPLQDLKALNELMGILKRLPDVDVIHLHSSKAGFLGRAACRLIGLKQVIYTPNGASFARTDISARKKSLYIQLEKIADKLSGQVVCCSPSESLSYKEIGIKSSYINNGTVIPASTPANSAHLTDTKPEAVFTIVTCGRVTEQKNPALFNQIAAYFAQQKTINFIWVGEGDAEQKAHLSSHNIQLTGWLHKNKIDDIISGADLYMSTSLWEGLPFSVLEALSFGKCLLLTNCVGNVDLVQDGYNGFAFDTAEEAIERIQWLVLNREAIRQMEQNSREWSEKAFDIRIVSKQYQNLYTSLAAGIPKSSYSCF